MTPLTPAPASPPRQPEAPPSPPHLARPGRRIAVVGGGVSGLVSAWLLSRAHEVTVFEAGHRVGGHTNTLEVEEHDRRLAIDTGFIVFNEPNYPGFTKVLDALGVRSKPSDMSFSVRCDRTGLEYRGSSLDTLFAQRKNLVRPRVYRMIRDILRFNGEAPADLASAPDTLTLGAYLEAKRFRGSFVDHYVLPMGAALWSADPQTVLEFPARYFVEFFENHGFLEVGRRPTWRVVEGGSYRYVERLVRPFADRIRTRTPVRGVRRTPAGVEIETDAAGTERFDAVVLAVHSDQALRMLCDPSEAEREILGAIPYQANPTTLHKDARAMPRTPRAWASWNYHVPRSPRRAAAVTYHMNRLQGLEATRNYFVSLNRDASIRDEDALARMVYEHPIYTPWTRRAQRRRAEISGHRATWYCGAYWGHGFHEDGVQSALAVCRDFRLAV